MQRILNRNPREGRSVWKDPALLIVILAIIVFLFIFVIYPMFAVLKQSLLSSSNKLSFMGYFTNITNAQVLQSLRNTLVLGVLVGALSTAVGFLFAYTDTYISTPFKKVFNVISILPIVSPPFVLCLSLIMLFGNKGLISYYLFHLENTNIYGFKGLLIVQTLTFFPVAYMVLSGLLKRIDPSLEEAARSMGASRWKTFVTVTLPLMAPGIANAFLLTFIETVADFSNPMVIGGNYSTLATQIYMQATASYDMQGAAVVSVLLLAISMTLFVVEKYFIEKKSYVTVTGKSSRERTLVKEKKVAYPFNIVCMAITVFISILYLLIPLGAFFKTWGQDYSFTLDNFKYVFNVGQSALIDTTWLSAVAMIFTGTLAMVIAFLIVRKRFLGRGFIEFTSMLAMAVPGTIIGIGYILAFNDKPIYLTGTAAIIIICFIVRSLPVGIRSGITSLQQIDPSIEEAASDLGANTNKVFTSVTLPLIKSAFFSGLVYSFVRSMTAVSAVIFLVSAQCSLITVGIMNETDVGRFSVASAYSTVLIIIVFAAICIMNVLIKKFGSRESALSYEQ